MCWSTMPPRPSSRRREQSVVSRRRRGSGADAARRDVLHARCRQALDRGATQGRRAEHPLDLDHYRPRLHRALGDGEVGHSRDDQEPRGGVGTEGHPHRGDCARRVSDPGRIGPASPRGPRRRLGLAKSARSRRRASRACRSCELPGFRFAPATSMARWWCRTAARICAVPAPRTCCNGPTRSGKSSARHGRKRKHEPIGTTFATRAGSQGAGSRAFP